MSAPKEIITILSPDEVHLALAEFVFKRRGIRYTGNADINLMTMTDRVTRNPIQYRLSIKPRS
jgi:hypothetical protein